MAELFFSLALPFQPQHAHQQDHAILLSGPPSCGKTSLLFQFAINCASQSQNGHVVFMCNKKKLESKPPFLSQGSDPDSEVFQRIQMKYIENDEDIKKYFAAFHLYENFPAAVIIDDFADFFNDRECQVRYANSRGRDLAMTRCLALSQDALHQAKLHLNGLCKFLISDTHKGENPRSLFIYKRWIPRIYTVKGNASGSSYLLTSTSSSSGQKKFAKYSLALQYLALEEIIQE